MHDVRKASMTADAADGDKAAALEHLSRFVVGEAPLDALMQQITATAKELIDPVTDASITFTRGDDRGWTVASTGDLATKLDEAQYELAHGPCMDAASGGTVMLIEDLSTDDRYPDYGPVAAAAGVRSSLSMPFPLQNDVVAALNLYSHEIAGFTSDDVALAQDIATRAAVALANAVRYDEVARLAEQLQEAMRSRAVIEQAKGIIMAVTRCTPDAAFDILVRGSQRENRKLREVAADIVERHSRAEDQQPG
jgi:GAF domain-containing protein